MCPASGCKSPWIGSPRSYADASSYSDVDHCGGISLVLFNLSHLSHGGCVAVGLEYNWSGLAKFALKKSNHVGHISSTLFWGRCDVTKGFWFLVQIWRTKWSDSYGRVRGDFQTDKLERGSTWCKTSLLCPEQCHKLATVLLQYLLAIDLYIITRSMRTLWLVNQLWFIVPVNPRKNRASSELLYKSNRPQFSLVYKLINHLGCW